MQSSNEREVHSYYRTAFVCFLCLAACLFFDIRKYILASRILFDVEFFVSLLLYVLLIFLGIRSIRKGKGRKQPDDDKSDLLT